MTPGKGGRSPMNSAPPPRAFPNSGLNSVQCKVRHSLCDSGSKWQNQQLPQNHTLLLSSSHRGVAWDHSREQTNDCWCGETANSGSPAHFSLCHLSLPNSGSLEIILTIWVCLLGFTFDSILIALQKSKSKCLMNFSFLIVGQGEEDEVLFFK